MKKYLRIFLSITFLLLVILTSAQEFRGGEITFERTGAEDYNFYFDIYLYSEDSINIPFLSINYMGLINDTADLINQNNLDNNIHLLKFKSSYHLPGSGTSFYIEVNNLFPLPTLNNYQSNKDTFFLFRNLFIPFVTQSGLNSSPYFSNHQIFSINHQGVWTHEPSAIDPDNDDLSFEFIDFNEWSNTYWNIDYEFPESSNYFKIDSTNGKILWNNPTKAGFYLIGIKVTETIPNWIALGEIFRIMIVEIKEEDIITNTTEIKRINQIKISPNPSSLSLIISIENQSSVEKSILKISNFLGQTFDQMHIHHLGKKWTHQLDVSEYPSGTYLLTLQSEDRIMTKKFVVQR